MNSGGVFFIVKFQLASSLLIAFLTKALTEMPLFLAIAAMALCSAGVILMVILPVYDLSGVILCLWQ
jgi:hypothetical protein